jgi:F-type H+-transporting ATPase subunit delta
VIEEVLALRYARALLDVGKAHNMIDDLSLQIKLFLDILEKQPKLDAVLCHPVISLQDKRELLHRLFNTGWFSEELEGLIHILVAKKRFCLLREISRVYNDLVLFLEKKLSVSVYSAIKLSEANKSKLIEKLSRKFKKDINLSCLVDPSLIAGLRLKVGSLTYDTSLKKNLSSLGLALR